MTQGIGLLSVRHLLRLAADSGIDMNLRDAGGKRFWCNSTSTEFKIPFEQVLQTEKCYLWAKSPSAEP